MMMRERAKLAVASTLASFAFVAAIYAYSAGSFGDSPEWLVIAISALPMSYFAHKLGDLNAREQRVREFDRRRVNITLALVALAAISSAITYRYLRHHHDQVPMRDADPVRSGN